VTTFVLQKTLTFEGECSGAGCSVDHSFALFDEVRRSRKEDHGVDAELAASLKALSDQCDLMKAMQDFFSTSCAQHCKASLDHTFSSCSMFSATCLKELHDLYYDDEQGEYSGYQIYTEETLNFVQTCGHQVQLSGFIACSFDDAHDGYDYAYENDMTAADCDGMCAESYDDDYGDDETVCDKFEVALAAAKFACETTPLYCTAVQLLTAAVSEAAAESDDDTVALPGTGEIDVAQTDSSAPTDNKIVEIKQALLTVEISGDVDSSSEVVTLFVGPQMTGVGVCDSSTKDWFIPSNCQDVDVSGFVTPTGQLAVSVDGSNSVADLGARLTVEYTYSVRDKETTTATSTTTVTATATTTTLVPWIAALNAAQADKDITDAAYNEALGVFDGIQNSITNITDRIDASCSGRRAARDGNTDCKAACQTSANAVNALMAGAGDSALPECYANCDLDNDGGTNDGTGTVADIPDVVAPIVTAAPDVSTRKMPSFCPGLFAERTLLETSLADALVVLAAATAAKEANDEVFAAASSEWQGEMDRLQLCADLSKAGLDYQTKVLLVAAAVLFIFQAGARWYRNTLELHSIPASVEIIVYFSMLDQVTDVTYISTEYFEPNDSSKSLKSMGVLFVVLPMAIMTAYFLFKGYRLITPANLRWRLELCTRPYTAVPRWLHYTLIYPILAAVPTVLLMALVVLPLPVEMLVPILKMGGLIGWERTKVMESSVREFSTKIAGQSMVFVPIVALIYALVLLGGLLTMMYWLILALTFPVLWAFMMVVRTFAILPKVWVWIETQSDYMTSFLEEQDETGLFSWRVRRAAGCGEDLGIFRIFHPKLKDNTKKVPEFDYEAMYLLLSETLIFEFLFESVRGFDCFCVHYCTCIINNIVLAGYLYPSQSLCASPSAY
jgi:hypothetical protein